MRIIEINTENTHQVNQFLDLPFNIYAKTPEWVPPLSIDARRMLDRKHHPYYQHSQAAFFMVIDEGNEPVGRIAVLDNRHYNEYNQASTAFFYLFECENNPDASLQLFEAAFHWARERNLNRITGPRGFSALDGLGMLVKGFEYRPAFGLLYNLAYYPALVEAAGFEADGELVSGYLNRSMQFPERIHQVARLLQERRGLHVAHFASRSNLRHFVPKLKELYNGALGVGDGNIPLTDEEVDALASQMIWFADPRLIKIVYKGQQPVGFLLAYPDISAALQRSHGRIFPFGWIGLLLELKRTKWININGAGMLEGFRGVGGTALLFSEMYKSVIENRYEHADIVQIGVENDKMQREMRKLGIEFYKVHRVYSRSI
jgi:hypothetical protein